jgi:hypothetical protein
MGDGQLIVLGTAISFTAFAGAYIYLRGAMLRAVQPESKPDPVPQADSKGHVTALYPEQSADDRAQSGAHRAAPRAASSRRG